PAPPAVLAATTTAAPQVQPSNSSIAYAKPDAVAAQKPNPATLVRWLYTTKKIRVRCRTPGRVSSLRFRWATWSRPTVNKETGTM
ncbi:hypothetical protein, partial [Mesorhizobium sp.]|uniref:hypothetical protein n=1 Tax=Mesorhizobium sp. TaxID=1871066 RepID=UPI0025F00029